MTTQLATEQSDEQLFERYVTHQDQQAFAELHSRHFEGLAYWVSQRYLFGDSEAAQDIVQQAFFNIHLEQASYDRTQQVLPWLRRIAFNQAINEGVKRRRVKRGGNQPVRSMTVFSRDHTTYGMEFHQPIVDKHQNPTTYEEDQDGDLESKEFSHEQIYEVLNSLNDEDRHILILVFYDDLSEREAAQELGITRHKLRTRTKTALSRARLKMESME